MSKAGFEPIERTLYLGRRRLGRFVQTGKKQFEAFGPDENSLGHFKTSKQVLGAIRDAQHARLDCPADAGDQGGFLRRPRHKRDHAGLHDRRGDRP
jgi:hypothetical protein